ncbi:MAG: response regulator [Patescibacteria group bacterium]
MKKIFIVDDDPAMLNLYTRTFKLSGHDVETATNGQEALDKLSASEQKPDVILLDIMMPKLSGFEVLENIKKNDSLAKIPVIALTNLASLRSASSDLEKIRALGAVDVVVKSDTDPKELVKRVESLMA